MRTTITLTAEAEFLVRQLMCEHGLEFKAAVNEAIVRGLKPESRRVETAVLDLGGPRVPVENAMRLAGELEDEALLEKHKIGK
ncbi:MAG: hypothetical protein LKI24_16085 [Acidipropionibacterium sp.]|jgi:hypothetical protein|nr:hypothetical protein [Acidipropionibacterium sp.]